MDNEKVQEKEQAIAELRRDAQERADADYESARCEAYFTSRGGWND